MIGKFQRLFHLRSSKRCKTAPLGAKILCINADHFGNSVTRAIDITDDGKSCALHIGEHHRPGPFFLCQLRDGGKFMCRVDLTINYKQIASLFKLFDKISHLKLLSSIQRALPKLGVNATRVVRASCVERSR